MSHTILLVQPGQKPETRTYSDYESVNECMEGVCKMFEEHLKRQNPNIPSITYDISQLFDFIDQLADLSCLVYQRSSNTYAPYNKDWIKEKIYILLRRQASKWIGSFYKLPNYTVWKSAIFLLLRFYVKLNQNSESMLKLSKSNLIWRKIWVAEKFLKFHTVAFKTSTHMFLAA